MCGCMFVHCWLTFRLQKYGASQHVAIYTMHTPDYDLLRGACSEVFSVLVLTCSQPLLVQWIVPSVRREGREKMWEREGRREGRSNREREWEWKGEREGGEEGKREKERGGGDGSYEKRRLKKKLVKKWLIIVKIKPQIFWQEHRISSLSWSKC